MSAATSRRAAVYASLAVAWVVAAWLLAKSVVPRDLELPPVDVDAVFGSGFVARAERYERFLYVNWALSQVAAARDARGLCAARSPPGARIGGGADRHRDAARDARARARVARRASVLRGLRSGGTDATALSRSAYVDVVLGGWLGARRHVPRALARARRRDGARAVARLVVVAPGGARARLRSPPRSSSSSRISRPASSLRAISAWSGRTSACARAEGVDGVPLRVEKVSGDTSTGERLRVRSRPVPADRRLGHAARRPLRATARSTSSSPTSSATSRATTSPKAIGWFALFALPAALVADARHPPSRRDGRARRPCRSHSWSSRSLQLAAVPAQNVVSRRMESEADWKALETTRDPTAARGLFRELAVTSLGDPSPPTWAYVVFATHPTLAQRVAMADAWAARGSR